jgi:hypothetical protein
MVDVKKIYVLRRKGWQMVCYWGQLYCICNLRFLHMQPSNAVADSSARLLYRGALSLPDSHLLLDGLTFFAFTHKAGLDLLQNPLALALESMRGRQSLSFIGLQKLEDIWMDHSGDVCMSVFSFSCCCRSHHFVSRDIHPNAIISRMYFENIFCLLPADSTLAHKTSEVGVKVALGDAGSNNPGTSPFNSTDHS